MNDEGKKRAPDKTVGRFEDPDLVPVMNLVCVLIPLVPLEHDLAGFRAVTTVRGQRSGRRACRGSTEEAPPGRRSHPEVDHADGGSLGKPEVMPPDAETGTTGRVSIPHVEPDDGGHPAAGGVVQQRSGCAVRRLRVLALRRRSSASGWEDPAGVVQVPDLKAFNLALRGIHDRTATAFPGGLADQSQLNVSRRTTSRTAKPWR